MQGWPSCFGCLDATGNAPPRNNKGARGRPIFKSSKHDIYLSRSFANEAEQRPPSEPSRRCSIELKCPFGREKLIRCGLSACEGACDCDPSKTTSGPFQLLRERGALRWRKSWCRLNRALHFLFFVIVQSDPDICANANHVCAETAFLKI